MKYHDIVKMTVTHNPTPGYLELDCVDKKGKKYHTEGKTLVALQYGLVHGFGGSYDGLRMAKWPGEDLCCATNPCDWMVVAIYVRVLLEKLVFAEGTEIKPWSYEEIHEVWNRYKVGEWEHANSPFFTGYPYHSEWVHASGDWFDKHQLYVIDDYL